MASERADERVYSHLDLPMHLKNYEAERAIELATSFKTDFVSSFELPSKTKLPDRSTTRKRVVYRRTIPALKLPTATSFASFVILEHPIFATIGT